MRPFHDMFEHIDAWTFCDFRLEWKWTGYRGIFLSCVTLLPYLIMRNHQIVGPQMLVRDAEFKQILNTIQLPGRWLVTHVVAHEADGNRAIRVHILNAPAAANVDVAIVWNLQQKEFYIHL